jgi:hypothetical protein
MTAYILALYQEKVSPFFKNQTLTTSQNQNYFLSSGSYACCWLIIMGTPEKIFLILLEF